MKSLFIIPHESGCFWIRDVESSAPSILNEQKVGLLPVPADLEDPIIKWCSIIQNGCWDDYGHSGNDFLELGVAKIQLLLNWLPADWKVILIPHDFPPKFAEHVLKQKIEFSGNKEIPLKN